MENNKFNEKDFNGLIKTQKSNPFFSVPPQVRQNIKKIGKTLSGVDGFDEMAVAGASYLPKIWQPTAVCASLTVCSPLVLLGAMGIATHNQEQLNQTQHLKDRNVDLALKLLLYKDLPDDMKSKIESEFEKNNEKNKTHLATLNEILKKELTPDILKKAFVKLNIKFSDTANNKDLATALNAYYTRLENQEKLKTALGFIKNYNSISNDTEKSSELQAFIESNKPDHTTRTRNKFKR